MRFHIITLFPESFSYLEQSIFGRAKKNKKIEVRFYNPRDFTKDKHRTADDKPYGGGPGMVMKAEPILKAAALARGRRKKVKTILLTPGGGQFTNREAEKIARSYNDIILIAGHYEGVDERVAKILSADKVSIGPYTLTGGELPAMVVADAVTRHIPGALGSALSLEETRIASSEVYTRPEIITHKGKKYRVPAVLRSGDHKKIETWRMRHKKGNNKTQI